jgi:hypothetical protein
MKMYCLDANVFIQAWSDYYGIDQCPEYWEILDRLAKEKQVFCPEEVKREIDRQDDGLADWLRSRPHFVQDITADVQENLRVVLAQFPRLVDTKKDRSMADPWIIAHAMTVGASIVTKEMPVGLNAKAPKIPDACNHFAIDWMNDFQFTRELGIRFSAHQANGDT